MGPEVKRRDDDSEADDTTTVMIIKIFVVVAGQGGGEEQEYWSSGGVGQGTRIHIPLHSYVFLHSHSRMQQKIIGRPWHSTVRVRPRLGGCWRRVRL
jgi:hypothetical protein